MFVTVISKTENWRTKQINEAAKAVINVLRHEENKKVKLT